jgi:TnpA family transposase
MAKRMFLKDQDRRRLFDISVDKDSLVRRYSLSLADRLEIELRRRDHNRLGVAIQLCLLRYPAECGGAEGTPPRAMDFC